MERFWNRIQYNIYLFENNATFFFKKILTIIFYPIMKIKYLEKILQKRNNSYEKIGKIVVKTLNDPRNGKSITLAGIHMGGMLVLLQYSLFNFLQAGLGRSLIQYVYDEGIYRWLFIGGMVGIAGIINNKLLWKNDKYLRYFKEFKKESKAVKQKWAWISFGVVVSIILLLVFSFYMLIHMSH